jgi:hypothetical protein
MRRLDDRTSNQHATALRDARRFVLGAIDSTPRHPSSGSSIHPSNDLCRTASRVGAAAPTEVMNTRP